MPFEAPNNEFEEMKEDTQERAEANVDPETDEEIAGLSKEHEEAERKALEEEEEKEAA
jgi:hypothetical protein